MTERILRFSLALLLLPASEAHAYQSKAQVYGKWSLYSIENYEVAVGGHHVVLPSVCVVETSDGNYKLAFVAFPPFVNNGDFDYAGTITGQATSSAWKFKVLEGNLELSSEVKPPFDLVVSDALYDDDMIMFYLGGHGQPPGELDFFSQVASGKLTLTGFTGKVLANYSTEGLATAYAKLLECGGIRKPVEPSP